VASLAAAALVGYQLADASRVRSAAPRQSSVESRLSGALRDRDLLTRSAELSAALQDLDEANIEAALEVLKAQRVGVTAFEVRLFMSAWSRFDPAGAFAWAHSWQGPWRNTLERAALYSWAFHEPLGAARTVEAMDESRADELRKSLVAAWVRGGDIEGATDYLFARPASRERSRLIGMLLAELIQLGQGPAAVRSWAEGVPAGAPNQAKATAFLTAGGALAQNDPRNAVAFFEAHQAADYAQPALGTIARRWVDFHEPAALFAWLASLPPGSGRDDAVAAGFSRWWDRSPREARSWLIESSSDDALGPAVAVFARQTSRVSAARAADWADRIQDAALRRRTLTPILMQWAAEDRKAARAWMKTHAVPEEVRRELLSS
jgi:hypothetical protein